MINIVSSNFGYQERKKKQIHITTKEPDVVATTCRNGTCDMLALAKLLVGYLSRSSKVDFIHFYFLSFIFLFLFLFSFILYFYF